MIDSVLDFWFGATRSVNELRVDVIQEQSTYWFQADNQFDQTIKQHFESILIKAQKSELSVWEATPSGMLALVILLDQFSRNVYRGSSQAFAQDSQALALCYQGFDNQFDQQLTIIERSFFYLPLEHSENINDQRMSVDMFTQLQLDAPDYLKNYAGNALHYAKEHFVIIKQFGRYPHRNKLLNRQSTDAERLFLANGASSFGQ